MFNLLLNMLLLLANVLAVALPIAVVCLSWMPVREANAIAASYKEAALRLGVLIWHFVFCVATLPRFIRVFEDFGINLPGMTRIALGLLDQRQTAARFVFIFVLLGVALQIALFAWLRHDERHVATANRVSICSTLLFVLEISVIVVALALPLFKLLNDLS